MLGAMKNCTARLACTSVKLLGSDGLSANDPNAPPENVLVTRLKASVVEMVLPDDGRSGVLLYRYSSSCTDSRYSPLAPPSRSKMLSDTSAVDGSTTSASICGQL